MDCESTRLAEDATREKNWKRWGPYLSERQWGTVREDYSPDGACWGYFPHDHARSRAYRWGEDGLLGICDRECRLCFGVALWNNKDPILKERLFGLTGPEGNHGEDCKELYYYLDSTPTHSYMRALYKYPQAEFPYAALVETNRSRTRTDPEYELEDTGVLEQGVWDVVAEYAKEDDNDIVARFSITNSGPATATVDVLPTLWFRNTWIWGCHHEGCTLKPVIKQTSTASQAGDLLTPAPAAAAATSTPTTTTPTTTAAAATSAAASARPKEPVDSGRAPSSGPSLTSTTDSSSASATTAPPNATVVAARRVSGLSTNTSTPDVAADPVPLRPAPASHEVPSPEESSGHPQSSHSSRQFSAVTRHDTLEPFSIDAGPAQLDETTWVDPVMLFTENETNTLRLFDSPNYTPYTKDAFHRYLIAHEKDAVSPHGRGTKLAYHYHLTLAPRQTAIIRIRLRGSGTAPLSSAHSATDPIICDAIIAKRRNEADAFYAARIPPSLTAEETLIARQAYAGLLWTKQFYHFVVNDWLQGDEAMPPPPSGRLQGRNRDWKHMYSRDIISMPDKWEYPWFAAWDLAFHMLPMSRVDPKFAKDQLVLLLREWYMHPNGQIPAYEFAFDDVNPPVHAWAVWRVYNISGVEGKRDHLFLARCFHKLTINFTWWVNRIDVDGRNLFGGGFLGLDNIGVFDRGKPLPVGGTLEQADGTSWMAFYCVTMLDMALELARTDSAYEDIASKFFEHFVEIVDTMNDSKHGRGLWDEEDGFYYDRIRYPDGSSEKLKISSLVAIIPLYACLVLDDAELKEVPHFRKRLLWFMKYRKDLAKSVSFMVDQEGGAWNDPSPAAANRRYLLAIPSKERLTKVLSRVLDEKQFLSPYGIRSLSKQHESEPFIYKNGDEEYRVDYSPGEADSPIYGGNSNWRGPVWMPCNWLLVESLNRYHYFYGDAFTVECPTGSGVRMTLEQVATELTSRLTRPFLPNADGLRPCYGSYAPMYKQPGWQDLVQFHEYFHAETGRGCGASHQTGWTALVARCFDLLSHRREKPE
eukprot:m.189722 g.189722  ORF g.189722 m.189722 type:complete len:1040 (+) comp15433_c0_seq4:243-3362(+)